MKVRIVVFAGTLLGLAMSVGAQSGTTSLTGTWVGGGHKLDNGEQDNLFVVVHQDGEKLTGRVHAFGWKDDLSGTLVGGQLKLYREWDKGLELSGTVNGQDLELSMWGGAPMHFRPEQPGDEPALKYIPPPTLQAMTWNGLAKTPPMGWNSWNHFNGGITDAIVRDVADAMVSSGMRDAGYVYLNIDDTWEGVRDQAGVLQSNSKFPDMKALSDYVHSKGLKLGIYSSPGPRTCGGYPASYGHEEQDARTWASWGIDYVKYDWCSADSVYKQEDLQPIYQRMGAALEAAGKAAGRPMIYSLCEYGEGDVWKWGPAVGGNLWRTTGDISDEWKSMMGNARSQAALAPYAGPGHWNDPDMLEVGNGKMSDGEYRTHMSLWALLAAPLLAGNDVRTMTAATKTILLNPDVIAVDQDAKGEEAKLAYLSPGEREIWVRHLADGSEAIGMINTGSEPAKMTLSASEFGLAKVKSAKDLWTHQPAVFVNGVYTAVVPTHGVVMLRVWP